MKKIIVIELMILIVLSLTSCKSKYIIKEETNIEFYPTIDFLQPWAFHDYTNEQIENHLIKLKSLGIDTLIIQNTCTYENGELITCYYKENFLDMIVDKAKEHQMKIILGLSYDEGWWSYDTHNYNNDYVLQLIKNDVTTFTYLSNKYNPDGWYLSNEMYTNNKGYEKAWGKIINQLIEVIDNKTPLTPLYMSPFVSSAFRMTNNMKLRMWRNFFEIASLRSIDVFMPQDGYGSLTAVYDGKEAAKINKYNYELKNICTKYSNAQFYLNVELFASDGYGTMERLDQQIKFANSIACKIGCFSMSHYYILKSENGLDIKYQEYKK